MHASNLFNLIRTIVAIACLWMGVATTSNAQTNTIDIAINTAMAIPKCMNYKVRGACFWLKCSAFPPHCAIKTTVRIQHFVPEVVVSTWHEAGAHPWQDYGRLLAVGLNGAGSTILGIPIDSAGTHSPEDRTDRNHLFRDADAIGNPLAALNFILSGSFPSLTSPRAIPFPTPVEMMKFPSTMGSILSQWSTVPSTVAGASLTEIKKLADIPAKVATIGGDIAAIPGKLSSVTTSLGKLSTLMRGGKIPGISGTSPSSPPGGGPFRMPSLSSLGISTGGLGIFGSLFCPPTSKPFALHFQSILDVLAWRNVLPGEMLYPDSWIPGFNEVGNFPSNTWGNVYPRSGEITQQLTIKGSAVLGQRVASIISRPAQPHIYAPLYTQGSFKYFQPEGINANDPGNSTWQRLYPNATKTCEAFGSNDSTSLTSWGDGNTTSEESYAWNLWRRIECCQENGIYLGSVTR